MHCPHCGSPKDCAKNRLFSVHALTLNCTNCKRNTTSTRWACCKPTLWHHCQVHRELGMWCGTKPTLTETRIKRPATLEAAARLAEARHMAKIRRIGNLGEPALTPRVTPSKNSIFCHATSWVNSTRSLSSFENKKKQKNRNGSIWGSASP